MDLSLLRPSTSISPLLRTHHFRLPLSLRRRNPRTARCRTLAIRAAAAASTDNSDCPVDPSIFGGSREVSGLQALVGAFSPPARLIAAEMFTDHPRKLAEENISAALDILKSRRKAIGMTQVVQELEKVLAFNDLLTQLSKHPKASRFVPGVAPVSLLGGEYDTDRKMEDLKLLYRAYVAESFRNRRFEEKKLLASNHLKNICGLGKREAEAIFLDITSKIYRKRLSQVFSNCDLEAAPSKEAFLQNLCGELHFNPQKASEIHEEIYRQKLQQAVADGELDGTDVAALLRLRVLLCIPQETVDAAHADICGQLFEKVVKDAVASGVEGYDADVRASVRKASQGLRLTKDAAMTIASKAVRKAFMNYIQRARSTGDRVESARELKKMIAFNTLVVTELISDIKGETVTESAEPVIETPKQTEEEDEWELLQTLRKARPNQEHQEKLRKPGQMEINLKDDLSQREKTDLLALLSFWGGYCSPIQSEDHYEERQQ